LIFIHVIINGAVALEAGWGDVTAPQQTARQLLPDQRSSYKTSASGNIACVGNAVPNDTVMALKYSAL
jgi:hypothetical protein